MTDENKLRKYSRIGFALSCIFNSVLLLMGGFCLIVQEYFPDLSDKLTISIGIDNMTTGFPPIDIFLLPFAFLFELIIMGIYVYFPLLFGAAGLIRNILTKLFELKNADTNEAYKRIKNISDTDFVFILLNIALSFGFSDLGIYTKIHTTINIFMAAVLCILMFARPRIQKPEQDENAENL